MKNKIAKILKDYTKKNRISASYVILEDYAEELVKNGCIIVELGNQVNAEPKEMEEKG